MIFPSPHASEQLLAVVISPSVHVQPDSTAQLEFHPSLFALLPSSQYPEVGKVTKPSPHMSIQVLAVVVVPPEHVHFDSTVHVESHPSLFEVFPSSQ